MLCNDLVSTSNQLSREPYTIPLPTRNTDETTNRLFRPFVSKLRLDFTYRSLVSATPRLRFMKPLIPDLISQAFYHAAYERYYSVFFKSAKAGPKKLFTSPHGCIEISQWKTLLSAASSAPQFSPFFYYPNQRRVDVVDGIKARYVESFILGDLAKDASVQPRGCK